jgi:hypothetical protein
LRLHAPEANQQVDTIAKGIAQTQQSGNRVFEITAGQVGLEARCLEHMLKALRLAYTEGHYSIRIHAGSHSSVDRGRQRAYYCVFDLLAGKDVDDIEQ